MNRRGTNQYKNKKRFIDTWQGTLTLGTLFIISILIFSLLIRKEAMEQAYAETPIISGLGSSPTPTPIKKIVKAPSDKEKIVAYITRLWEKHGTDQVVRAINCFYSESGLRPNAVGKNTDGPRSSDHGIAQLNDHWHKLTEAQKTDIYANLDKAYAIYVGRGNNFSAWYGKLCN